MEEKSFMKKIGYAEKQLLKFMDYCSRFLFVIFTNFFVISHWEECLLWITKIFSWTNKILLTQLKFWFSQQNFGWVNKILMGSPKFWLSQHNFVWVSTILFESTQFWLSQYNFGWISKILVEPTKFCST